MAEKRKLAFYIRLSDADEEVKAGTKDESNSITGQRKLLYSQVRLHTLSQMKQAHHW